MTDAANVMVGITGAVYVGPTSATAPSSTTSVLTSFDAIGYVTTDGVTFSTDKSTSQIRAYQKNDLVREVITETTVTYTFAALETNQTAVELYFGAPMVNGKVEFDPTSTGGVKSFVFDIVDGDEVIRHYVPRGEVTAISEQAVTNGEAVTYGFTVTAYAEDGRTVDVFHGKFES